MKLFKHLIDIRISIIILIKIKWKTLIDFLLFLMKNLFLIKLFFSIIRRLYLLNFFPLENNSKILRNMISGVKFISNYTFNINKNLYN